MATVKVRSFTFRATPLEQYPTGDWRMRAEEHTGITSPGTIVHVTPGEILSMAESEKPATSSDLPPVNPSAGLSALEAGMAQERKTLTPVTDLLKEVKTVPDRPTAPRMGRNPQPSRPKPQWGQRP